MAFWHCWRRTHLAWTRIGSLWIEHHLSDTAYMAVAPETPGSQPVWVSSHKLIRQTLVEAIVQTTFAHLQQSRSEQKLSEVARGALALYEKLWAEDSVKDQPVLACRKECSFCCHLDVSLTIAEALLLAEHLKATRSSVELIALRRQAEDHLARRQDLPSISPGTQPACPLLVENACSAYSVRPLHCRGANSLDARQCEAASRVDVYAPPLVLANSIMCGLEVALKLSGIAAPRQTVASSLVRLLA
jgi:Fe-S-cluster containining protein